MTTLYPIIKRATAFPYGEENAVASLYKWVKDVFGHAEGYPVYFDKDNDEFSNRSLTKMPCIVVQQIDTQDLTKNFIGGKANQMGLLFYFYFNHSLKDGGTRRLLRRGRDQMSYALKMAGITDKDGNFYVNPIFLYDFSTTPPTRLTGSLVVQGGIQQRFIQDGDILQYEMMVTFSYLERLVP